MQAKSYTRRLFLKTTALSATATLLTPHLSIKEAARASADKKKPGPLIFLFQGDSITDGNRGRNNDPNHIMGHGYAFSIASRVGASFPEKNLSFNNRGGKKIPWT